MKRLSTYLLAGIALLSASCSDFQQPGKQKLMPRVL